MQPDPTNNNAESIIPPIRLIEFSHLIFPRAGRRTRFNRPSCKIPPTLTNRYWGVNWKLSLYPEKG